MVRVVVRMGVLVALGCGLMLASVYAVAGMSGNAVREFYASKSCAAPCLLGIRMGETTIDDAQALLLDHPWIDDVRRNPDGDALNWRWNGTQPSFVTRYEDDQFVGQVNFRDGIAANIYLVTGTRFGDWVGAFGFPDQRYLITRVTSTRVLLVQTAAYFTRSLEVETTIRCPIRRLNAMWYSYATVRVPAQNPSLYAALSADWGC